MLYRKKGIFSLVLISVIAFGLAFSQAQAPDRPESSRETEQLTPFEKSCSVCHSLERVRLEMGKLFREMHQKAGIQLSEETVRGIEGTFTLKPVEEPHKTIFQEKCATCHSLEMVVSAHQTKDEGEMDEIIRRMAGKEKSGISQEEIEKIHESMNMLNEIYEEDIEVKSEQKK
jgi:cytochrome c5